MENDKTFRLAAHLGSFTLTSQQSRSAKSVNDAHFDKNTDKGGGGARRDESIASRTEGRRGANSLRKV